MFRLNTISEELSQLNKALESRIEVIKKRYKNAPEGSLRIISKWNKHQYYQKINIGDTEGKYIPRKEHETAIRLAQKDYDKKLLETLTNQQKAIERFLKDYDPDAAMQVYEKLSEPRKELITPEFLSDDDYIAQWLNEPYKKLGFKPDDPEFYTAKGERVRSKSEILIADALLRNNIPYRYEYPVFSNGVIIGAPDFNCLNVRLRKDYYWEHLGKLGDQDYSDRNVKKLEQYALSEDFDETRLILTFETDKHPLNTKVIEEKIRRYLL